MRNYPKTRVLLVEAEPMAQRGLAALLKAQEGLEIVARAGTIAEGRALCEKLRPELAVVDVAMDGREGLGLVREMRREVPGVKVVALTRLEDAASIREALLVGVVGYVSRLDPEEALLTALAEVLAGRKFVGPRAAAGLLEAFTGNGWTRTAPTAVATLTRRERQIFWLLGEGSKVCDIGQKLKIAVTTVETHVKHTKEKLGLRSLAALRRTATLAQLAGPRSAEEDAELAGEED
ncbi:MAG: response regulator transcription factor [Chthoniobacter sp.]|nr:response regulator transcription factor [Chthoniobacter sp.]